MYWLSCTVVRGMNGVEDVPSYPPLIAPLYHFRHLQGPCTLIHNSYFEVIV